MASEQPATTTTTTMVIDGDAEADHNDDGSGDGEARAVVKSMARLVGKPPPSSPPFSAFTQ
jgi:hypothetical protein